MCLLFHHSTLLSWLCWLLILVTYGNVRRSFFVSSKVIDDYDWDTGKQTARDRIPISSGANANLCPKPRIQNGRVKIRSRGRVAKFVCNSNYEILGKRFLTCIRGHWSSAAPVCVVQGCMRQKPPKNGRVMETYKGAFLQIDCYPGYVLSGARSLYCNGLIWNGTMPTCQPVTQNPSFSCDFEKDNLCGWSHDLTSEFEWERHNFGTPSGHVGTGPSHDHTKGEGADGYYMYIEASSPRKENDTARFLSPVYSPKDATNSCFSFWYHMYGGTTGQLKVYVKPESKTIQEITPSFDKSGDQGNRWILGRFAMPVLNENFQIIIEGIRGTSYVGDTAIDDVKISALTDCFVTEETATVPEGGSSPRNINGSCIGRCSISNPEMEECQCIDTCEAQGTCCSDYDHVCVSKDTNITTDPLPTSIPKNKTRSCRGRCNISNPDEMEECQCDETCVTHGTCCSDYDDVCVAKPSKDANITVNPVSAPTPRTRGGSCRGRCPITTRKMEECQCHETCETEGTCCSDYHDVCVLTDTDITANPVSAPTPRVGGGSCRGRCPISARKVETCQCHDTCEIEGTCCSDYRDVCVSQGTIPTAPSGRMTKAPAATRTVYTSYTAPTQAATARPSTMVDRTIVTSFSIPAMATTKKIKEITYVFTPWPRRPTPTAPRSAQKRMLDIPRKVAKGTMSAALMIGTVAGIIAACSAVGSLVYYVYKRIHNKQDKLAEDSDVRYLKDGETVDFNEGTLVSEDEEQL